MIVFLSNCELVNFLWTLMTKLNWRSLGKREEDWNEQGQNKDGEEKPEVMFDGFIYKLHGNMDHELRKHNYFGFDGKEHALLICTDVASRGLDFKHVEWIV